MSVNNIVNELRKHLDNLAATNPICDSLGTSLTSAKNLFMYEEPSSASQCMTIIPYPGPPPTREGDRQEAAIQIRLKTPSNAKAMTTMQAVINHLHNRDNVCASGSGRVSAVQSNPVFLAPLEGGELSVIVSNYTVKHIKL